MRRCITLLAAFAALAACAQNDQRLPIEPEADAPVTGTMGASATTVSTPTGLSVTVPAGAVQQGTRITVAHLDATALSTIPAVGDAYLIGFDNVPASDPTVSFSLAVDNATTAGELVGMVPIVLRLGTPGTTSLRRRVVSTGPAFAIDDGNVLEKFEQLKAQGIFEGVQGSASLMDDATRARLRSLLQDLAALNAAPPPATPVFSDVPETAWYDETFIPPDLDAFVTMELRPDEEHAFWSSLPFMDGLPPIPDPATLEQLQEELANGGAVYLITNIKSSFLAVRGIVPLPPNDASSFPLIPADSTSATFEMVCSGMQWPTADGVPLCSEKTIDVRAGAALLTRLPASLIVPNYLASQMTIGVDGSARGTVQYDLFVRAALSSGVTGVERSGAFDLAGTWSASGDTITIGGHAFQYATPDAHTLILTVSDSVRIENNDGTDSWEPVEANVKLTRR